MNNHQPLDLSLDPDQVEQLITQRRYCPLHHVMIEATSEVRGQRFPCPVVGCDSKKLTPKPKTSAPAEPITCSNCKNVACESDAKRSTRFFLRMACDKCGWSIKIPRADIHYRKLKQDQRNLARYRWPV